VAEGTDRRDASLNATREEDLLMPVHDKLLEVLVCPACKGSLQQVRAQGDSPDADAAAALLCLDCPRCRLRFSVIDDIPVMLVDQAQRIPG